MRERVRGWEPCKVVGQGLHEMAGGLLGRQAGTGGVQPYNHGKRPFFPRTREVLLLCLLEVEGAVVQRLVVVLLEDLLPRLHHLSLGLRGQREAGTSRRH